MIKINHFGVNRKSILISLKKQNYKKCLIIVPVYNEQGSLQQLIERIKSSSSKQKDIDIKILFINDGSTDDSELILIKNKVNYINLVNNLGLGASTQSGYKYAAAGNFDYVIKIDGDGQHPPEEMGKLIDAADNNNADLIIGSRFITETGYKPSFSRKIGMLYSSWLLRLVSGLWITDTTSGYLLVKKNLVSLFAKEYPQFTAGLIFLLIANKAGFKFKEIPIRIVSREYGKSSINFFMALIYPSNTLINVVAMLIRK